MTSTKGARDALVTGMGFCLPGRTGPTATPDAFWAAVAHGDSFLRQDDGTYFGSVPLDPGTVTERLPEIPARFVEKYSDIHLYGLLALVEACADADLDWRAGALREAAVLAARNATADAIVDTYLPVLLADARHITPREARSLLFRNVLNAVMSDVETTQAGLVGATGPSYTLSCGCASSAVLLGNAARMIAAGEVDIAVVTGADYWRESRLRQYAELEERSVSGTEPQTATLVDRPMRPYDERAAGLNYGNGAATLVLESRAHAERRQARVYGRILAQTTTRNAQPNLALDLAGSGAVRAARSALRGIATPQEIDYVNGAATGDRAFNVMESTLMPAIFGDRTATLPVTVQEAVFGHSGAPLGAIGVAATLLMMRHGHIAPTANCEKPADVCTFDPVPGTRGRPARIDLALSLNYTIGSVASAIVLGGADD
ncbi:beta-ketoacyl synthase N-terminal-like domain-containing protein [Streptomyces dubilierae]|uniref:Beta-ketoacyl synthase N-terminal-like domain-containing protein n=1 Tax=Streptomyces dubilierae TaxID=3075533 RepID=A0ABU2PIT3_9ACTN|nr:beta-ketoacyl synthase N-terminal-like domain-containing protein [Streptomyces sp. DSM 41921]MDT0392068.1 beta-ketoacyl synthase N-terminal-like domain-containing protein [Streptomyces sp. DSM 41921]